MSDCCGATRGVASLRWFRAESCYVFHVLNAWDEGDRIIVDVMRVPRRAAAVSARRWPPVGPVEHPRAAGPLDA